MAQLTALDAGFLKSRDPERHPGLAIGAVAVVNGAAPSYDQLKTVLTERIKSIPRCTQVLATEWIDYPGFDLTQHVRRVALPGPATKPSCSGPSRWHWSVPSTRTARCGNAGSSKASTATAGRS